MTDLVTLAAHRRAQIEGIFVITPRIRKAHERFQFLIEHGAVTTSSKLCVLLAAPSNSGKSKIVETFANKNNTEELLKNKKIPVLHVTLQAEVTVKGLASDILIAIKEITEDETDPTHGSQHELWERVYKYLRSAEVKLLVLDEIQHLKHSTSERSARLVGECIKRALLKGPCPIVLSGIESAEMPFIANEQLQRRAMPAIKLEPFKPSVSSDLQLFMEFLAEFLVQVEEVGAAKNAAWLMEGDVPACMLQVSGGVLGEACRLVMEAVEVMTYDGRDRLRREDLITATDEAFIRGSATLTNPFVVGLRSLGRGD